MTVRMSLFFVVLALVLGTPGSPVAGNDFDTAEEVTLYVRGCNGKIAGSIQTLRKAGFVNTAEMLYREALAERKGCFKVSLTAPAVEEDWARDLLVIGASADNGLVIMQIPELGRVFVFWPLMPFATGQ